MAVTDLRTLIDDGTDNTNWTDAAGGGFGTNSTEVFPPGASGSLTEKISKAVDGLMYNTGATGNFAAGDHLFLWYSFLFGALDTVAGGGIRVRVAGATITDWAEVYIDGNDSGKSGWQMAVISLDAILANPDGTNGTPPTAANVQRVGIIFDVTATVGGNNDNVAVQGIWRSPSSLIASYRIDGGTDAAPNTWQDLIDHSLTNALGLVVAEPNGATTLRCPIVFGPTANAISTFEDTNVVLAFDASTGMIESDFYKLTGEAGGAADVRITAGTKLGSGETAVGVAGWTIVTGGPRWALDFEDADLNDVQFYGCSFSGSADMPVNVAAVEMISNVFSDCGTIDMVGGASGPTLLSNFFAACPGPRPQIVFTSGVTPLDGQFDFNTFANMSWFAIEIPSATTEFNLRGVGFADNGTDRDILLSHTTGDIQLNILETGDTPGVTNGATHTISLFGACDVVAWTVGTWTEADDVDTDDAARQGALANQTTASYTADDDSFAVAAAVPGPRRGDTITYTGSGDEFDDSHLLEVLSTGGGLICRLGADNQTPAAGTRAGFPVHALAETEGVQGIIHVNAETGSTPVVSRDATNGPLGVRENRPWQVAEGVSSVTFSYGAGVSADVGRVAYCAVVALDGVAANTQTTGINLNRSGGTTPWNGRDTNFPVQDDNVGSTGRSLELRAFEFDVTAEGQDLDQGTFDVNNNVTLTVQVDDEDGNPVEGARVRIQRISDGTLVSNGSTDASGTYTDSTFNFVSDLDVQTRVRLKGFKPFRAGGTITNTGLSVGVTFQNDPAVDRP